MKVPGNISRLYEPLIELFLDCGMTSLLLREEGLVVEQKGDGTEVTNADYALDELIRPFLKKQFPEYGVVTEESLGSYGSEGTWFVDPIDGTVDYLDGKRWYRVMAGLVREELFGVAYFPAMNKWIWGEEGKGCYLFEDGSVDSLRFDESPASLDVCARMHRRRVSYPRFRRGVVAAGEEVVRGGFGAYVTDDVKYWDVLPPVAWVLAAGGVAVDFSGRPLVFDRDDFVCPEVVFGHPAVVDRVLREL